MGERCAEPTWAHSHAARLGTARRGVAAYRSPRGLAFACLRAPLRVSTGKSHRARPVRPLYCSGAALWWRWPANPRLHTVRAAHQQQASRRVAWAACPVRRRTHGRERTHELVVLIRRGISRAAPSAEQSPLEDARSRRRRTCKYRCYLLQLAHSCDQGPQGKGGEGVGRGGRVSTANCHCHGAKQSACNRTYVPDDQSSGKHTTRKPHLLSVKRLSGMG